MDNEYEFDSSTRRGKRNSNDDLNNIKLKIPTFFGRNNPEAFLEWLDEVESIFGVRNYSDETKLGLVLTELKSYVKTWWNKLTYDRERDRELPVETWSELKRLMRKRFIQPWYQRDMIKKLQRINQGNRSVEEYFQELEAALHRVQIDENPEATIEMS